MKIATDKVYTFKLNSGEELVAKVKLVSDGWVEIENPVIVAPGPQGLGLVPAMFTANPQENPQLNIDTVAIYAPTDDSVRNRYLEATTGIKIPDKKIIMG